MPRQATPPRLIQRGDRLYIRYKDARISTGCGPDERQRAEEKLEAFAASVYGVARKQRRIHEIPIADVINLYATEKAPDQASPDKVGWRLGKLLEWWGEMKLDEVNGATCRQYAKHRGGSNARRELEDLRAAIKYHKKEGLALELVSVTLPPDSLPRERWLTRQEVAKLIRICLHHETDSQRQRPLRHLARFIVFAVYTGSRPGDCLRASFRLSSESGYINTGSGLYHRKPSGKRETKKRQPITPLPARLLAHLRRWERAGAGHVTEFNSSRVGNIKTAWKSLVRAAGPGFRDVVPYTLRHTAITWMLQKGVGIWEVSGYVGTSPEMIQKTYGHHAPEYMQEAVKSFSRSGK